jgi:hypothetical protein
MSSANARTASVLRSSPFDKSTPESLALFRVSFILVQARKEARTVKRALALFYFSLDNTRYFEKRRNCVIIHKDRIMNSFPLK